MKCFHLNVLPQSAVAGSVTPLVFNRGVLVALSIFSKKHR